MFVSRSSIAIVAVLGLSLAMATQAASLSFTGNFSKDDDVQLFNFSVTTPSTVTLVTWSYAGGVNSAGTSIPEGGFDPILALYNAAGTFIDNNDDGDCGQVPESVVTGSCFDTYFQSTIQPGDYTVAIQQYDNFALGNLSDGFSETGLPFFTSEYGCSNGQFCDVDGYNRTKAWAFDILNVDSAAVVPLPASIWFLVTGIAGLVWRSRRHTAS